jgi:hypothetical protein
MCSIFESFLLRLILLPNAQLRHSPNSPKLLFPKLSVKLKAKRAIKIRATRSREVRHNLPPLKIKPCKYCRPFSARETNFVERRSVK